MSEKPVFVVSDIHLGAVPDATEQSFRRFLRHVADSASRLLINGDLFDFWFEYASVIQSKHYRVLAALADVREAGVEILFVGGNHDAWGGSFLRDDVGVHLLPERSELILAGRKALVVHGDGVGKGDLGYRALKMVIRNRISIRAFRALHPDWAASLARLVSTTESKTGDTLERHARRAAALARWAEEQIERRPELDLILAGHTHTPAVFEFRPGRFYVNTGDWINHFTYLTLREDGRPDLRKWDG